MKVIVDAMGGDHAPQAVVAGAVDAVNEDNLSVILVGQEDKIRRELKTHDYPPEQIEIHHAPEVVGMHEPATVSIRQKKNSSISVGINLLKEMKDCAFVSAGNTGAVVAASTIKLRMIEGVARPAIGLFLPTLKGFGFFIDVGANTDPKPEHLLQNSLMAHVYVQHAMSITNPSIGLLNIGSEESKGTDFNKVTHKLLANRVPNFIGNVEANEVYQGKCDCVICDGYVGNILIKVSQGLMESTGKLIKREVKKDWFAGLGALIMKVRLKNIKQLADYSEYGAAPLLGVNGIVMISHGRSGPKAIKNAIKVSKKEIEANIIANLKEEIAKS